MNNSHVQYKNESHKEFYKYCNALRCPLCNSQLDGGIYEKSASLYCSSFSDEYNLRVKSNKEVIFETVNHYYDSFRYEVTTNFLNNKYIISVNRFSLLVKPSITHTTRVHILSFKTNNKIVLFSSRIKEADLLEKIKKYSLFI